MISLEPKDIKFSSEFILFMEKLSDEIDLIIIEHNKNKFTKKNNLVNNNNNDTSIEKLQPYCK